MQRPEEIFTLTKPKWEWRKIKGDMLFKIGPSSQLRTIQPKAKFEIQDQESNPRNLKFRVAIDTEKSPIFCEQLGWNWHKSCIFPRILVKAELFDPATKEVHPLPSNLQARLFMTKFAQKSSDGQEKLFLQDVGIAGTTKSQFSQGVASFRRVVFTTTSYINQDSKLNLLILISVVAEEPEQIGQIVCSFISSPLFIDSRKFASQYYEKKTLSFIQIFQPDQLTKQFEKNQIVDNVFSQTKIENNVEGLYHYLTALNIRNKIKHPLFLAIKFSNAFKIYMNKQEMSPNSVKLQVASPQTQAKQIILKLQEILNNELSNKKKSARQQLKHTKLFLFKINGQCKKIMITKILENLQFLSCSSIELVKSTNVNKRYSQIILQEENLSQAYCAAYQQLRTLRKNTILAKEQFLRNERDYSQRNNQFGNLVEEEDEDSNQGQYFESRCIQTRNRLKNKVICQKIQAQSSKLAESKQEGSVQKGCSKSNENKQTSHLSNMKITSQKKKQNTVLKNPFENANDVNQILSKNEEISSLTLTLKLQFELLKNELISQINYQNSVLMNVLASNEQMKQQYDNYLKQMKSSQPFLDRNLNSLGQNKPNIFNLFNNSFYPSLNPGIKGLFDRRFD